MNVFFGLVWIYPFVHLTIVICPGSFYYGQSSSRFNQDFFLVEPERERGFLYGDRQRKCFSVDRQRNL
jgi:hypothetical protein